MKCEMIYTDDRQLTFNFIMKAIKENSKLHVFKFLPTPINISYPAKDHYIAINNDENYLLVDNQRNLTKTVDDEFLEKCMTNDNFHTEIL